MFKLLKNAHVFAPEDLGIRDILIAGERIALVEKDINITGLEIEEYNLNGKTALPGFIDQHVHIIGGGGEAGYASRTPEIMLSDLTTSGITTVAGLLGTDGITRHMESLLAKARGLESEGLTSYIYTGCYQVPTCTITGSIRSDIILIDKVIGAGEIAISDHRSSQPTIEELKRIAAEARVGGMLSGKAGIVHLHVGSGERALSMLFEIVEDTEIPVTQFVPTHMNRSRTLLECGIGWGRIGGYIDITSGVSPKTDADGSVKPSEAVRTYLENGIPLENITMSSDGNGSMPLFNEKREVKGLMVADCHTLYEEFICMVRDGMNMSEAVSIITANVAKRLRVYPEKGSISAGSDADIVVLDDSMGIEMVFARGRLMVENGQAVVKGTFE
ncbi:beta-aspartyl-peptidase [Calorimonas adulescens]|uniref:Isoaspartyl dipeptidase n=1 Tax=Calorimonas adulescens TaxID=2606906 RepID=A0A5D8QA76_9THEO|nr:beta-aspartyl-peptidase [Calorimonas adulescens]TZE81372.1 beta-aspartyl-peptidase [Calorimonas adulescens]